MVATGDQDLPGAGRTLDLAQRQLGGLRLRRVDPMERMRPKGDPSHEVGRAAVGGLVAVAAVRALHRQGLDLEGLSLERPIGDDRGPPAGDRVAAELEHGGIVLDARGGSAGTEGVDDLVGIAADDRRAVQLHGADVRRARERVARGPRAARWAAPSPSPALPPAAAATGRG